MEDPINANPTIIDVADLPTRDDDSKKKNQHQVLMDRILSLSLATPSHTYDPAHNLPELTTSSGSEAEELDSNAEQEEEEEEEEEPIDSQEIFDLILTISDPEHPLTLAQLAVVNLEDITVENNPRDHISEVLIKITPTITHCSLATLIGLGIRVRLERSLPPRFRIKILIKEGTHQSENQVNKQLNDKERVAAACENDQLLSVILQMLSSCK